MLIYDEAERNPREGFPTGKQWSEIPSDWPCPDYAVREQPDFVKIAD